MTCLAIDAGNSSVKVALWTGVAWHGVVRFASAPAPPEAWAVRLRALAPDLAGTPAGLASVVPAITDALAEGVRLATGAAPTRVSAGLDLPFAMGYRTPETLGADRVAAAVAAWHAGGGRPVVAIDAGTAVTVDAVDVRRGRPVYLGGAIAPGPALLLRALARETGALPAVSLAETVRPVGDSTAEAIRTGVWTLFSAGVARLAAQTAEALSSRPLVTLTGGWAERLAEDGLRVDRVAPTLVLDGVRRLCPGSPIRG